MLEACVTLGTVHTCGRVSGGSSWIGVSLGRAAQAVRAVILLVCFGVGLVFGPECAGVPFSFSETGNLAFARGGHTAISDLSKSGILMGIHPQV